MEQDVFGCRNASAGDLFTGQIRWNREALSRFEKAVVGMFGKYAYFSAVSAEKNVQEFMANAKNMIVVVGFPSSDFDSHIMKS